MKREKIIKIIGKHFAKIEQYADGQNCPEAKENEDYGDSCARCESKDCPVQECATELSKTK